MGETAVAGQYVHAKSLESSRSYTPPPRPQHTQLCPTAPHSHPPAWMKLSFSSIFK